MAASILIVRVSAGLAVLLVVILPIVIFIIKVLIWVFKALLVVAVVAAGLWVWASLSTGDGRRSGYARRRTSSRTKFKRVRGYTLRDRWGRVKYVGITNNPRRRASEHRRSGKRGEMRVETGSLSREGARRWERARLAGHRKRAGGKNPRYNKTRDGGYRHRSKGRW